jgi:hypothetical protein
LRLWAVLDVALVWHRTDESRKDETPARGVCGWLRYYGPIQPGHGMSLWVGLGGYWQFRRCVLWAPFCRSGAFTGWGSSSALGIIGALLGFVRIGLMGAVSGSSIFLRLAAVVPEWVLHAICLTFWPRVTGSCGAPCLWCRFGCFGRSAGLGYWGSGCSWRNRGLVFLRAVS